MQTEALSRITAKTKQTKLVSDVSDFAQLTNLLRFRRKKNVAAKIDVTLSQPTRDESK